MWQTRRGSNAWIGIVALSLLSFVSISSADTGDEALLKQAQSIFGSLPRVMASGKNPITPEKVKLVKYSFTRHEFRWTGR